MTEEQTNQTPKQTEFTIQIPDREVQWEKCPVYVTKTRHQLFTLQPKLLMVKKLWILIL